MISKQDFSCGGVGQGGAGVLTLSTSTTCSQVPGGEAVCDVKTLGDGSLVTYCDVGGGDSV